MNELITTLATLNEYQRVAVGGYDWILWTSHGGSRRSLIPTGEKPLNGCSISEIPGSGGEPPTFDVAFNHPALRDLRASRRGFPSLAAAAAWATTFQWATRQAGSLTWLGESTDSNHWYAEIGLSQAAIYESEQNGTFLVTRKVRFGNQEIEFKIQDLAFGKDEPKMITTFEQASAIVLTMTDYVMELMRNVQATH